MILDGKAVASEIYNDLSQKIQKLDTPPTIGVILVGGNDSPSLRYIKRKRYYAEKIWMKFHLIQLPADISETTLLKEIEALNQDPHISWFMVQTPLPKSINNLRVLNAIHPEKDVDGFHPENQGKVIIWDTSGFTPCTPAGVMKILEYYSIALLGKKVVVIWRSNIVWKPLCNLLINAWATVISCNSHTPDISEYTGDADIVISAVWKPGLIQAPMIHPEAVIIDVWFSVKEWKIYGDSEYEALLSQWSSITPVPGGVGPMTVAILLQNTYQAHVSHLWKKKV